MYTVRTRSGTGRVPGRVLPRTGCFTGVIGTRTDHVHRPCTAVHSLYTAAHGRLQTVYTAVFTALCTAVYVPCI